MYSQLLNRVEDGFTPLLLAVSQDMTLAFKSLTESDLLGKIRNPCQAVTSGKCASLSVGLALSILPCISACQSLCTALNSLDTTIVQTCRWCGICRDALSAML